MLGNVLKQLVVALAKSARFHAARVLPHKEPKASVASSAPRESIPKEQALDAPVVGRPHRRVQRTLQPQAAQECAERDGICGMVIGLIHRAYLQSA